MLALMEEANTDQLVGKLIKMRCMSSQSFTVSLQLDSWLVKFLTARM